MFFDDAQEHPSQSDTPESGIRFAMMLAELWHDWFEAMSEVAYQTHRACEFFVQHGGSPNGQHGRFVPRAAHMKGRTARSIWTNSRSAYNRWIPCRRRGSCTPFRRCKPWRPC